MQILVGVVAEIALIILFTNFSYKFGGKFFHQKSGKPIGLRATGAAVQLVMENRARIYRTILQNSGILAALMAEYVENGRQITSALEIGMRFYPQTRLFKFNKDGAIEDIKKQEEGETNNQRMARVCKTAKNSINEDLVFTTESQEAFKKERLTTIDFEMWIKGNKIKHGYFLKPMNRVAKTLRSS